ncbi:hypothetical protein V500_00860 [Pseudogymnoascus sp. VKM F-4518 (FW-2643)]|nr:hypothetical protein V500_00860 [Pseudogymnoascus sp. VKM F-4518 (FW-2643)]
MLGNKYRIYVAAYVRDGISTCYELEPQYGYAMYHWGIWVEPKNGKGKGQSFHVREHEPMNSASGPIPGGWRFELQTEDGSANPRLVGRLMVGKLPSGKGYVDIEEFLSKLPLPAEASTDENCISWVKTAVQAFQKLEPQPWAEDFDVDQFMAFAFENFKKWHRQDGWQFSNVKFNYANNRFQDFTTFSVASGPGFPFLPLGVPACLPWERGAGQMEQPEKENRLDGDGDGASRGAPISGLADLPCLNAPAASIVLGGVSLSSVPGGVLGQHSASFAAAAVSFLAGSSAASPPTDRKPVVDQANESTGTSHEDVSKPQLARIVAA